MRIISRWLPFPIALLGALVAAGFAWGVFEGLPHLEDEFAYLFQARVFALGRLSIPIPTHATAFWQPFVLDYHGQRFGKYPPGWPLLLAAGVRADLPWLVNPLLGGLTLYLLYRLGHILYDSRTGLLAAALGATSPLYLTLSGSLMSHTAAGMWLLLFALAFIRAKRTRRRGWGLAAGLAWGAAFLTRPLTAVGAGLPVVAWALVQWWGRLSSRSAERSRRSLSGQQTGKTSARLRRAFGPSASTELGEVLRPRAQSRRSVEPSAPLCWVLPLGAGALGLAALLPLYNWTLTGHPSLALYTLLWPYDRLGFGPGIGLQPGGHTPLQALLNLARDLTRMATHLLGWPALSWLFLPVALFARPRARRDGALLLPLAGLIATHALYWIGGGRVYGPRYYYEAAPFLWLLTAHGISKLDGRLKRRGRAAAGVLVSLLLASNLLLTIPSRIAALHGLYDVSRAQLAPVEEARVHNALVLCVPAYWRDCGAALAHMRLPPGGDVIYALAGNGEENGALVADYPDRAVYFLVDGELIPVDEGP